MARELERSDAEPLREPRDRLRFKHKASRKRSSSRDHACTNGYRKRQDLTNSTARRASKDVYNEDDEAFYASGAAYASEPSLLATTQTKNFTEHLFDALADGEGREYWQTIYGQPIHDVPRPDDEMTDDEYAAYVRRGMWQRLHKDEVEARRIKKQKEADDKASRKEHVKRQEGERLSRERERIKALLQERWKVYLADWQALGSSKWSVKAVPWPTLQGTAESLGRTAVEAFLSFAGDARAMAREELRRRWHPDRFQQRAQRHILETDVEMVSTYVTKVAQILNEIIGE